MSRKSRGDFSWDSSTSGSSAGASAKAAISPYEIRRPLAACTTVLGSVVSSATGTFHSRATLSSNTRRIWAPAMRSLEKYPVTERLPTVNILPRPPRLQLRP